MELNLEGIESVLPQNPAIISTFPDLDLDLTGIAKVLPKSAKKSPDDRIVFQPEDVDWNPARLSSIQEFFKQNFKSDLPVTNLGQGGIHNKWSLDHRSSVDVGLDPDSEQGKRTIAYLKENKIPFLAFRKAIPGVSTGKHIHVGKPSQETKEKFIKGTTINDLPEVELDLVGIDELLPTQETSQLDLKGIEGTLPIEALAQDDFSLALDPNKLDFKEGTREVPGLASYATRFNKPQIVGKDPFQAGELIEAEFGFATSPNTNVALDNLLMKWNPDYIDLNDQFRAETGGLNLINIDNQAGFIEDLGNNKYKVKARPTRGATALIEAYKTGGLPAYNATLMLIHKQQEEAVKANRIDDEKLRAIEKAHPYLAAFTAGVQSEAKSIAQLGTNLKYLGAALAIGHTKGYDSQEYLDLINKETEEQENLAGIERSMYQPPSFGGKLVAGGTAGGLMLPRAIIAGGFGIAGLPLMSYAENLHRGNRTAALAALPMAILVGTGKGLQKFTDISPAGSSAPFRVTRTNLRALEETIAKKESISIQQLTPFERQLVHRGTNALSLQVPQEGQDWQDFATNMVVGLGFPVGKSPGKVTYPHTIEGQKNIVPFEIGNRRTFVPIVSPEIQIIKPSREVVGNLGQGRINIPLTKSPVYGKLPVVESERGVPPVIYPSSETPNITKYGEPFDPAQYVAETETGFQARGQGATLHLDLDTANLNLLELKRTLEEGTYKTKGDDLKTSLSKQQAIKNAIQILETAIPEQSKEFFKENEQIIRAALKSNYTLSRARNLGEVERDISRIGEAFPELFRKDSTISPSEVRTFEPETPRVVTGNETTAEIFAGRAGDLNSWGTTQEGAHKVLNEFFKITTQGSRQSTILPYGDVFAQKAADLCYLGAFYIEDFYRRGVVPTVDILYNKLKTSLGDYGKHLTEEHAKRAFQDGMDYYNSNVADPFFSKMKQDAAERLPNRFIVQQARDILAQHGTESEWTAGLEDFLKENEGKRINKKELIEVINKGQVRVEESVASDELHISRDARLQEISNEIQLLIGKDLIEGSMDDSDLFALDFGENKNFRLRELISERNNWMEQDEAPYNPTKYSLKAYAGEKLELPGAINSKEVKLISPFVDITKIYDPVSEGYVRTDKAAIETKYQSPHWDEPNVVAHYRSNDRTTTDGKRIYFSEEFQSDWNHDIREKGLLTKAPEGMNYEIFNNKTGETIGFERNINDVETFLKNNPDISYGIDYEHVSNRRVTSGKIEPNPFMAHNWKELISKRFLRDAVIAKDESGNYKYDGIGWTTARQQKERYGKILEGKDFKWQKNRDGTYSFGFKQTDGGGFDFPHELNNISLERFAELTTKEAAQEVRDQEADHAPEEFRQEQLTGKFSLKEAVELRSGIGKYSDYDVALVNIAKKIGKRFGAEYRQKEIEIGRLYNTINEDGRILASEKSSKIYKEYEAVGGLEEGLRIEEIPQTEKVHHLEITPSMRQSLEKEGLPLYGTGGQESLKSQEAGVRNVLTTQQGFDQHRDSLVKSLEETVKEPSPNWKYENISETDVGTGLNRIVRGDIVDQKLIQQELPTRRNNIFNSGLSPDAFVDQAKLLYKGYTEFAEFSRELISRFGEQVRPFLQDLWMQVKGLAKKFHEDERGFLNLQLRTQAGRDYKEKNRNKPYYENYSLWRGVGLAQLDVRAGEVIDILRQGQRVKNSFEHNVLQNLRGANKLVKNGLDQAVADNLWIGNENKITYSDAELAAGDPVLNRPALNPDEINAYKKVRASVEINLDIRRETKLYSLRERATRLNNQLNAATLGTPQYDAILTKILDISDAINNVNTHFATLKSEGYISTQRKGPIAAYAEDASGKLYQHFDNLKEADAWIAQQEVNGANPTLSEIHDIRKPERLRIASAKLTPGQFEDLIDSAGVSPHAPEIEKIRDEVYSRFPSFGYELKRDFVRGYNRDWKFVLQSVASQTETYANSFYSRVAGEEGLKTLDSLGLQKDDYALHKVLQKYIDHEISSPEITTATKAFGMARKGVYLFQLGADVNQLYLNAIAQPVSQTYSYFARVQHNGIGLKGLEPEKYWGQAWKLAGQIAKGTAPIEFQNIYKRLVAEQVVSPEYNKFLLEGEIQKTVQARLEPKNIRKRLEHWSGVFMRAGEKTTRTHAAAEAYLVGKNKFNLAGEELVNFIVRAVDATQSNPTRAEAPLVIRGSQNQGEIRKLLYQFNAFNHMWVENLALNVRADFQAGNINATSRHIAPLVLMSGVTGLPLAGLIGGLAEAITGEDPRKTFHKFMGSRSYLERMALYGITGNATFSQKTSPTIPFVEDIGADLIMSDKTLGEIFISSRIPAISTSAQIGTGLKDIAKGDYLRGIGGAAPLKPIRNIATAIRYKNQGIRTRGNRTILPKSKVTSSQLFFQGLGIAPSKLTEYYDEKSREKRSAVVKRLKKIL